MDLSVCVVNWNVCDDLANCLESLRGGMRGVDGEIIVVDNASADGSVEMVQRRFPHVRLIVNDANVGFAAANVQAMHESSGRYILLLNPDTLVPPGAMRELVDFADAHPEAGIVGPKLVYGDGSLQASCRCFPTVQAALFRNTVLGGLFPKARASSCYLMEDWDHSSVREVDWVSGACLMVRRETYEQVGDLDAGFYWGSEDVDFCWRAHKAGWRVLYTPSPVITHLVGRSTNQVVFRTIVRHHRSMYRLYSKHIATNPVSRALVWLGVWTRAGVVILQDLARHVWGRLLQIARRAGRQEVRAQG
ncbi:MAG: glycosyltransferase family 2 protein [Armatimonadetes bacterium]|nr:glycosyltransferase family 2 protein [Armatimonadota bacterium]